jgi:hypothetical protein
VKSRFNLDCLLIFGRRWYYYICIIIL